MPLFIPFISGVFALVLSFGRFGARWLPFSTIDPARVKPLRKDNLLLL
jgi:hypothetical protein